MGIIKRTDYTDLMKRLNAIRTKHNIGNLQISSPAIVVITANKMNELLSSTVGSKWISSSLGNNVSVNSVIRQSLLNDVNSRLSEWENTCIHDTDKTNDRHYAEYSNQTGDALACFDNFQGTGDNISNFTDDTEFGDDTNNSPDR